MILRRLLLASLVAVCGCNVLLTDDSFVEHGYRWQIERGGCATDLCRTYAWRKIEPPLNLANICAARPMESVYGCADRSTCTVYSSMDEETAKKFFAPGTDQSHRDHEVEMHLRRCLGAH